jgi:hypothetical protein
VIQDHVDALARNWRDLALFSLAMLFLRRSGSSFASFALHCLKARLFAAI